LLHHGFVHVGIVVERRERPWPVFSNSMQHMSILVELSTLLPIQVRLRAEPRIKERLLLHAVCVTCFDLVELELGLVSQAASYLHLDVRIIDGVVRQQALGHVELIP